MAGTFKTKFRALKVSFFFSHTLCEKPLSDSNEQLSVC